MSESDAEKWNLRYREGAYLQRTHPSALLERWQARFAPSAVGRRAVDIGCGAGRNALYLARLGWSVTALDISQEALDRLTADAAKEDLSIDAVQADLEMTSALPAALVAGSDYDLALVVRYTNLPLIETLGAVLAPGGFLLFELHLQTEADVVGPRNPAFRIAPGTLRRAADGLRILEYREGLVEEPDGRLASLAQLVARAA